MGKLEGMYKQRLIINLATTLMITLTVINVIQIYLFSLGIFGIAAVGIILFFRYISSVDRLYNLQTTEGKAIAEKEGRKHNIKVYNSYKNTLISAVSNEPYLQFTDNKQKLMINNDDRMKYLNNLQEFLKTNYHIEFNSLNNLVVPYLDLAKSIQASNKTLMTKTNIDVLEDLNIKKGLVGNTDILHRFYSYLEEKSNMYSMEHYSISVGLEGEKKVNEELSLYDDMLVNMPNVRFEVQGLSVETDNFVISPFGIFAIEVKNLGSSGNFKIKIEKDGRWVKIFRNSSEVMKNVTSQTYRHIGLNQKLINQELKKLGYSDYIQIKPLIVMANENVEIINESDVPIVRISNIYHHISKFPKELDEDIIFATKKIVEDNMLPSKKYEIEDISNYIKDTAEYLQTSMSYYDNIYKILKEIEKQSK
jgi:uncharacterized protein YozE (UPF0346 family)